MAPIGPHALFPYKGSLWNSSVERGSLAYSSQELPQRSEIPELKSHRHRAAAVPAPRSLSPTQSLTAQNDVTKTLGLLSAGWRSGISWVTKLTSIATQRARSLNLAWPRFNFGDFLPGMLRRPGFLIILMLAGSIDVGMLTFIATGAQTQTDARTSSKLEDRLAR
jgi:hypothetical protein